MGTGEAVETWQNGYECVLLAPQVSYRLKQLQEEINLPIAEVPSLDYAIGNAENVMKMCIRDRNVIGDIVFDNFLIHSVSVVPFRSCPFRRLCRFVLAIRQGI